MSGFTRIGAGVTVVCLALWLAGPAAAQNVRIGDEELLVADRVEELAMARADGMRHLSAAAAAKAGVGSKTIVVECSNGESIAKALEDTAGELIIEIHGFCRENVQIWRHNVTLRGTDSDSDGVQAIAESGRFGALEVWYATNVHLEDLGVRGLGTTATGEPSRGLAFWFSTATIDNVDVTDNRRFGVVLASASEVWSASHLKIDGNAGYALRLGSGASMRCEECALSNNGGGAIIATGAGHSYSGSIYSFACDACTFDGNRRYALYVVGGFVELTNVVLSSRWGILAMWGDVATRGGTISTVPVDGMPAGPAVQGGSSGMVDLWGSRVLGPVGVSKGEVWFYGVSHVGDVSVGSDGTFLAYDWDNAKTSIEGNVAVLEWSNAQLFGDTTVTGNVTCERGGDAHADNPGNISGTVSGCAHLMKP